MAILVSLGVLTVALLLAADYVEDAFGAHLESPRAPEVVIPAFIIGVWNAVPATLAAVAYHERIVGAVTGLALALVSPACVLYVANEVAHDPDGSFIRLGYVFVPFWPNLICAGVIGALWMVKEAQRSDAGPDSKESK